jgi:UDPglucose 6-dehydrogenase
MAMSIGIMGTGMVGGAVRRYYESRGVTPYVYDKGKNEGSVADVNRADLVFICVPTPYDDAKGGFDLSFVKEAIGNLTGEKVVVLKSTIMPGSTEALQKEFPQHKIMYNPEFLTEMTADQDMSFPDRQILGVTEKSFTVAADVMALLPLAPYERIMPATAAEMVKYFGNTWFSTKVTFANQMYELCQRLGVEYDQVRDGVAADKRIGRTHLEIFHKGYRGYGGKCLPKDTRALIQLGERVGAPMRLLKLVEELNNELHRLQGLEPPKG